MAGRFFAETRFTAFGKKQPQIVLERALLRKNPVFLRENPPSVYALAPNNRPYNPLEMAFGS